MATEARKFAVGVFVIAALVIGVAAAIWLGASRYLADETLAVTYFQESVQGLDPGAAVKFRGVPAGRVEKIGIAPDGELIQVVMAIDSKYAQRILDDETLRAQLQLSGITGLRYVEIDKHSGEALQRHPEIHFEAPYPAVLSTPSQFKAVQEALEDIYAKVMSVDIGGVTNDLRATLQAADQVLRDERMQQILTNMSELTGSARRATENVEHMTAGVKLAPVVDDLRQTNSEARKFIQDLRDGATGRQLRATMGEIDAVARTTQSFVVELQVMVDRLNRASENLAHLTDILREQPSQLIFAPPPPPRSERDGGRP